MQNMNTISSGFFWKFLERIGVQGVQFILQIVLARLLDPEHYGVLSLMVIFTTLANVFVQNGFNTALIQSKDLEEEDYSSVFWVSFGIAGFLYLVLYISAPAIAAFYNMPEIVAPFRVLSLMLFPGAFNSVQLAKVRREMDFKKVFYSSIGAIILAGVVGIVLAYLGTGIWALVAQNLVNIVVSCLVMCFTVQWFPRFTLNLRRVKKLLSFGWKLIISSLIETAYQDLRSLVIGKKYNSGILGNYNRGKQFPQFIINAVNGTVQAVMLPAMAKQQDDKNRVKEMMRTSITLSSYIIFPMMAGLAGVAAPLVNILLTDKWAGCVPYMQIYCFTMAFMPVHSCNLQTINAIGRSDIFLKLEIIKKAYGIGALAIAVFCFDSPIAIAMTGIVTTVISCFVNASPNKKLVGYSYKEQMQDILPSFILSFVMFGIVSAIGLLGLDDIVTLIIQVLAGVVFYVGGSILLKLEPFAYVLQMLRKMRHR